MTDPLYDDAYIRGVAVGFAEGDSRRETLLRIADRVQHDHPDAKRYRMLRRGQHWSVIDGIGDTLIADGLDAAIDATMLKTPNVQIEPPSRPYATGRLERRVRLHVDCGNTNNA